MSEMHNRGMYARRLSHCLGFYCLVAMVLLMTLPVQGGSYLPLVGPPPLRFEKAMNHARISWIPPVMNSPPLATETNTIRVTPSIPSENVVVAPPATPINTVTGIAPVLVEPDKLSTNSIVQTRSANDLLVVTPEMLVDYFKPNNNMTNAGNVRVIAPVSFSPPASTSIPSSQAIYRSP